MKKKLKNIVKVLVVFVMLTSCATENLDLPNQDSSLVNAKIWFDTSKPNLKVLDYTNALDWNNAILTNGDKGTIVEVPLTLKGNFEAKVGDEKSLKTYHRLMFIPDEKERYKAYHVLITTNEKTFDSKSKAFNFYKLNTGFNGYVTVLNSKNEITDFDKYQDLKLVSKPLSHKLAPAELTCVYYGYLDEFNEFHKISLVYCYEPPGSGGGETTYGGEGGTGGGSGNASTNTGTVAIVVVAPTNKITDLKDYLRCFNLTINAQFTIYVDQPTANSGVSWSGSVTNPDVGHTFIAIQQGDIRRVFGYYPNGAVDPYSSPSGPSAFGNNQGHLFDVALTIPINPSQLQNIIRASENATTSTYNLNTYNCTDFGIQIGNLAGLNLPDAFGTWPGGGGSNPGQLGQVVRGMLVPPNAYRQITSTTAGLNDGQCN